MTGSQKPIIPETLGTNFRTEKPILSYPDRGPRSGRGLDGSAAELGAEFGK